MRGVRFTKAEAEEALAGLMWRASLTGRGSKAATMAITKMGLAMAESAPGINPGPLEEALVTTSLGKVVELGAGTGYARASKQATAVGATVEDAKLVGAWMARQGWLRGPQTIIEVLNKWPSWLAKARATAPPPSLKEGLGADAGSGTATTSEGAPRGRRARGFG